MNSLRCRMGGLTRKLARAQLPVLAMALTLILAVPAAKAENEWFNTEVQETGISKTGESMIKLTDTANAPAFANKWFLLPDKVRDQMLATSIAAVTADLQLRVKVDLEGPVPPLIKVMYLKNE